MRTLSITTEGKELDRELNMRKMCVWSLSKVTGSECGSAPFLNEYNADGLAKSTTYISCIHDKTCQIITLIKIIIQHD